MFYRTMAVIFVLFILFFTCCIFELGFIPSRDKTINVLLNEIRQNKISEFYGNIEMSMPDQKKNLLCWWINRDARGYAHLENTPVNYESNKGYTIEWNENLYFNSNILSVIKSTSPTNIWHMTILVFIIIVAVFIRVNSFRCEITSYKYFIFVSFALVLFSGAIITYYIYDKYYVPNHSVNLTQNDGKNINTKTNKILSEAKNSTLCKNIPPELEKMGFKNIFVAKSPTFSAEHVRLDIDKLSYVLCTKGSPKDVNPVMDYREISEGVWLGKYSELRENACLSNFICHCYAALIGTLTLLFICITYIQYKRNNLICKEINELLKKEKETPEKEFPLHLRNKKIL